MRCQARLRTPVDSGVTPGKVGPTPELGPPMGSQCGLTGTNGGISACLRATHGFKICILAWGGYQD